MILASTAILIALSTSTSTELRAQALLRAASRNHSELESQLTSWTGVMLKVGVSETDSEIPAFPVVAASRAKLQALCQAGHCALIQRRKSEFEVDRIRGELLIRQRDVKRPGYVDSRYAGAPALVTQHRHETVSEHWVTESAYMRLDFCPGTDFSTSRKLSPLYGERRWVRYPAEDAQHQSRLDLLPPRDLLMRGSRSPQLLQALADKVREMSELTFDSDETQATVSSQVTGAVNRLTFEKHEGRWLLSCLRADSEHWHHATSWKYETVGNTIVPCFYEEEHVHEGKVRLRLTVAISTSSVNKKRDSNIQLTDLSVREGDSLYDTQKESRAVFKDGALIEQASKR